MREQHVQRLYRALCLWRSDSKWFCVTKCTVHSTYATSNSDGMVCVGGGLCLTVSYWHRVEAWRLNFKTLTKRWGPVKVWKAYLKGIRFTFSLLFFYTPKNIVLKDSQVWQCTQQNLRVYKALPYKHFCIVILSLRGRPSGLYFPQLKKQETKVLKHQLSWPESHS